MVHRTKPAWWVAGIVCAVAGACAAPTVDADGDGPGASPSDAGRDGPSADAEAGPQGPPRAKLDLLRYVKPLIGTDDSRSPKPVAGGAGGSTYPGAVVPFGMVQLSPDTPTAEPSGYRDSDKEIDGVSLTHFNGAGCPNNEDIPFLPFVGSLDASPGDNWSSFKSAYSKDSEQASPGYYAVDLDRYKVRLELTATTRTGFARFTYPSSTSARVLLNAGRNGTGVRNGSIDIVGSDRIEGSATGGGFCAGGTFQLYFAVAFDRPFTDVGTWVGKQLSRDSKSASGTGSGGFVTFDTSTDHVVQMKIGLSYVSVENARANLEAENTGWDFDDVRHKAEAQWNDVLNRIQITGGAEDELEKFYTALYHVFQNPNVASDVNGEYLGFDNKVHTTKRVRYQNYSGWDIIRSWTHLVGAIAPETPDIIDSMVADGVEGGLLPFWTHQNIETHVMVGDPGTVNVANAYAMGVRGFDTAAALELMKKSADDPMHTQRPGLAEWIGQHYVGNAAMSLEYAMADFSLAQFARGVGDDAAYQRYLARSDYWRSHWHPEQKYLVPRVGGGAARIYELKVFGPASPATNLAVGRAVTASGTCNPATETADKAVNDNGSDKWCDNSSVDKWLEVDLGAVRSVDKFVLNHAGSGGEAKNLDTQDFVIQLSTDRQNWTKALDVKDNTADVSTHSITATNARYVRLVVTQPIQRAWDCQPFSPGGECGFVEGNAAQYVWMVPHNLEGVFNLMGGHETAISRLDDLFKELNAGTSNPYFYIGNEPEHGTPWTYNFAQAPAKSRAVVRRIIEEEFSTNAGGLPGNDDLGATSAWLVWSYLGLYPVVPGTDILVVHGPLFPSANLLLANGKTLLIEADDPSAPTVKALTVNGTATKKNWLRFTDVSGGGTLDFTMGSGGTWGTAPNDVPPAFPP